jgi:hypothetical protein
MAWIGEHRNGDQVTFLRVGPGRPINYDVPSNSARLSSRGLFSSSQTTTTTPLCRLTYHRFQCHTLLGPLIEGSNNFITLRVKYHAKFTVHTYVPISPTPTMAFLQAVPHPTAAASLPGIRSSLHHYIPHRPKYWIGRKEN